MPRNSHRKPAILFILALFGLALAAAEAASSPLFVLQDRFGASQPPQPIEVDSIDPTLLAELRGGTVHVVGPNGLETPFQVLSTDTLVVHSSLPGSPRRFQYGIIAADPDSNEIFLNTPHSLLAGAALSFVAQESNGPLPGGLSEGVIYYVHSVRYDSWYNTPRYRLSVDASLAEVVDIKSTGNADLIAHALVFENATNSFYRLDHQYFRGMPLSLDMDPARTDLPTPLSPIGTYYVIPLNNNRFQLAATVADAHANIAISIVAATDAALPYDGWVRLEFHVADGAPSPLVAPAHPASGTYTDDGRFYEVTNGLTGVRITFINAMPPVLAPIQGILGADGVWYADNDGAKNATLRVPDIRSHKFDLLVAEDLLSKYNFEVIESGSLLVRVRASYETNRPRYGDGSRWYVTSVDVNKNTLIVKDDEGNAGLSWHTRWPVEPIAAPDAELPCGLLSGVTYYPTVDFWDPVAKLTYVRLLQTPTGPEVDITCTGTGGANAFWLTETINFNGTGFFTQEITLYANHKSILIEDDFDTELQYFVNLYKSAKFEPNTARFRGFGTDDTACGYQISPDGTEEAAVIGGYTMTDVISPFDYTNSRIPMAPGAGKCADPTRWRSAPTWYMGTGVNSGYYWMLYNSTDASRNANAPLFGYFLGRLSSYLQTLNTGPSVYTSPTHEDSGYGPAAGFTNYFFTRRADGQRTTRTRKQWGIYASLASELKPLSEYQPIAIERHALAGIRISSLIRYQLDFPSPAAWQAIGGDATNFNKMVAKITTNDTFANYLLTYNPTRPYGDIVQYIRNRTTASAEEILREMELFTWQVANIMSSGDGAFDKRVHFYTMVSDWQTLHQYKARVLLTLGGLTTAQEDRVKACLAFIGGIIWDNDFMPFEHDVFDEAGNANQNAALVYHRAQSALILPNHPAMATRLPTARSMVLTKFNEYVSAEGAPRGGTWYERPGVDPAILAMLEFGTFGSPRQYDRVVSYASWYLSALTPHEPQIAGGRKLVALGDGSTYSSSFAAVVGKLLRKLFGPTSIRATELQWAWAEQQTAYSKIVYDTDWAPTFLIIDPDARANRPLLGSVNFPGYWTSLRQAQHTPYETAAWLIKGPFYIDHRHFDMGQLTMYALSAPLIIDWNANINHPATYGGYLHSKVFYERSLASISVSAWDSPEASIRGGDYDPFYYGWPDDSSRSESVPNFNQASYASSVSLVRDTLLDSWKRAVTLVSRTPDRPIIFVRDEFTGPGAGEAKVLSWWVEASGEMETPAGPMTPPPRFYSRDDTSSELPSATPAASFPAGEYRRFGFSGNQFPLHRAGGIDFDVHVDAGNAVDAPQFVVGAWSTQALSGREDYESDHLRGDTYRDRQSVIRVRSRASSLGTVFLPVEKGSFAAAGVVRRAPCGTLVTRADVGDRACFSAAGYSYADGLSVSVASYGVAPVWVDSELGTAARLAVEGGAAEVTCDLVLGTARVTLLGPAGTRMVTIACLGAAVAFAQDDNPMSVGNQFTFVYAGGFTVQYSFVALPTNTSIASETYRDPQEAMRVAADGYAGLLVLRRTGLAFACRSTAKGSSCMSLAADGGTKWTEVRGIGRDGVWVRGYEVHSGTVFGSPSIEDLTLYLLRDGQWKLASESWISLYAQEGAVDGTVPIPLKKGFPVPPVRVPPAQGSAFRTYLWATQRGVGTSTVDNPTTVRYSAVFDCTEECPARRR